VPFPKSNFVVKPDRKPVVLVTLEDWERITYLVRKAPKEVLWYMLIERDDSHPKGVIYRLKNMYIPKQRCGNKEVETPDGQALIDMWLQAAGGDSNEAMNLAAEGGCWAHSHVDMPTTPSEQDVQQWSAIKAGAQKATNPRPQAMLIVNRKDEYTLHLYDPEYRLEFENPTVHIDKPWDFKDIDAEISSKLTIMKGDTSSVSTTTPSTTGTSGVHSTYSPSNNTEVVGFIFTTLEKNEKKS